MGEAHKEMGNGERSQCESKAEQLGTYRKFPSLPGPPPGANCSKEGVQVESTTTQRTQS